MREQVGMEVPLSADHFGHIGVNSCIRLGKALEKYNMAWLEDMMPWQIHGLTEEDLRRGGYSALHGRRYLPQGGV